MQIFCTTTKQMVDHNFLLHLLLPRASRSTIAGKIWAAATGVTHRRAAPPRPPRSVASDGRKRPDATVKIHQPPSQFWLTAALCCPFARPQDTGCEVPHGQSLAESTGRIQYM
jgi:hypothetical protein